MSHVTCYPSLTQTATAAATDPPPSNSPTAVSGPNKAHMDTIFKTLEMYNKTIICDHNGRGTTAH